MRVAYQRTHTIWFHFNGDDRYLGDFQRSASTTEAHVTTVFQFDNDGPTIRIINFIKTNVALTWI